MILLSKFMQRYRLIAIIACVVIGMLSGVVNTPENMEWYQNLNRPSFNPPSWVFGPVWTVLYIMIGMTFGELISKPINKSLLFIFSLQFLLNIIWSPLFFGFQRIDLALYDLILLWSLLAIFLFKARYSRAFYLTIPYFLWVSFAGVLNTTIYFIN